MSPARFHCANPLPDACLASIPLFKRRFFLLFMFFPSQLRLVLFLYLLVKSLVSFIVQVGFIGWLCFLFHVKVNFKRSTWEILQLFSVHFNQSCLCANVILENHVCKTFWLIGLPVSADSNFLYFAKRSESVANVILFKWVRKAFYEDSFAVFWHVLGNFDVVFLSAYRLSTSSWFALQIPCS